MSESWWEALEDHLARRDGVGADDPWGDVDLPTPPLTDAQRDYLAQLADQPPVPRLRGPQPSTGGDVDTPVEAGSTTGNSPGEPEIDGGVPSPP